MGEKVPLFDLDRDSSTILRGIAILFILLGHTNYYVWGGAGGVTLFLLLSGYGLHLSCENGGFEHYWNKRLRKVYYPYLPVALFVLAGWRIRDFRVIICTVLGLDFGFIADSTMWYISFIFLWYVAYYLIARLSRLIANQRLRSIILLIGLFAAAFGFRILARKGVWHGASGAELYVFAFPLGVLMIELRQVKVTANTRTVFQLAILFVTCAYMLGEYAQVRSSWMEMILVALVMGIQPIAVVQLVKIRGHFARVLQWFGKYSFPIYLFEGIFLPVRNQWFAQMMYQPLIDLAFFGVSIGFAVIFWEGIFPKLESLLRLNRTHRV